MLLMVPFLLPFCGAGILTVRYFLLPGADLKRNIDRMRRERPTEKEKDRQMINRKKSAAQEKDEGQAKKVKDKNQDQHEQDPKNGSTNHQPMQQQQEVQNQEFQGQKHPLKIDLLLVLVSVGSLLVVLFLTSSRVAFTIVFVASTFFLPVMTFHFYQTVNIVDNNFFLLKRFGEFCCGSLVLGYCGGSFITFYFPNYHKNRLWLTQDVGVPDMLSDFLLVSIASWFVIPVFYKLGSVCIWGHLRGVTQGFDREMGEQKLMLAGFERGMGHTYRRSGSRSFRNRYHHEIVGFSLMLWMMIVRFIIGRFLLLKSDNLFLLVLVVLKDMIYTYVNYILKFDIRYQMLSLRNFSRRNSITACDNYQNTNNNKKKNDNNKNADLLVELEVDWMFPEEARAGDDGLVHAKVVLLRMFVKTVVRFEQFQRGCVLFNVFSRDFLFLVPEVICYPRSYKRRVHFPQSDNKKKNQGKQDINDKYSLTSKVLEEVFSFPTQEGFSRTMMFRFGTESMLVCNLPEYVDEVFFQKMDKQLNNNNGPNNKQRSGSNENNDNLINTKEKIETGTEQCNQEQTRKNVNVLRVPQTIKSQFAVVHAVLQARIHKHFCCRSCAKFASSLIMLCSQVIYPYFFGGACGQFEGEDASQTIPVWQRYYDHERMTVPHGFRVAVTFVCADLFEMFIIMGPPIRLWGFSLFGGGVHRQTELPSFVNVLCDHDLWSQTGKLLPLMYIFSTAIYAMNFFTSMIL